MNRQRQQLIADLTADLRPVRPAGRTSALASAWVIAAVVVAIAVLLAGAPFRAGSLAQVWQIPRLLLEALLGLTAIVALAQAGFHLAVPGALQPARRAAVPLALVATWIGFQAYGLYDPAVAPSASGQRPFCDLEVAVAGLAALGLGMLAARRLWPLHGAWCGTLLGLAAGMVPAWLMQFACAYLPAHGVVFHVLPALAVGLAGLLLGSSLLRPR